jgi:RNA polymerase sigma-70 factor (ECF subfamily)
MQAVTKKAATGIQLLRRPAVFMVEDDDAAAAQECLAGNRQAFTRLVERYERPVYNVALRMLRNPEDARDVSQTVFLKAYQGLEKYDPQYKFYSWIYRIAINESLNVLRLRSREAGPVDDQVPSGDPGPAESLAEDAVQREVADAIEHLKPDYRAVIVLKYVADRSYEEIAGILGIEVKTVRSRLFTARQAMKDRLSARGVLE